MFLLSLYDTYLKMFEASEVFGKTIAAWYFSQTTLTLFRRKQTRKSADIAVGGYIQQLQNIHKATKNNTFWRVEKSTVSSLNAIIENDIVIIDEAVTGIANA